MTKYLKLLWAVLAFGLLLAQSAAAQAPVCQIAKGALSEASQIRKLKIKRQVPCLVQDREEVKKHLLDTISEKMSPDKLKLEGVVYGALGFFPDNFNYRDGVVDIYLSQIGGYYDPDKKRYIMAAWMPAMMQTTVAVHELTHALQDQYFDLTPFIDMKKYNGDELLARSALVEGDATAVMFDYGRALAGQEPIEKMPDVNALMLQSVIGASMAGGAQNTPQSLMSMLIFPYTSGLRFAHAVIRKGGYARLDQVYARPPRSTSEILHPEKYFQNNPDFLVFTDKDLTAPEELKDPEIKYSDTLGEFSISTLLNALGAGGQDSAEIAAAWKGDRVAIWQDRGGSARYLTWKINWDSSQSARRFSEAYLRGIKQSYPNANVGRAEKNWVRLTPHKQLKVLRAENYVTVMVELL